MNDTNSTQLALVRGRGKRPPEPTSKEPFAQVKWAFDRRMSRVPSRNGKENYKAGCSFLIKHLQVTRGSAPYFIAEEWDEFFLIRFRDSVEKRRRAGEVRLSSFTMTGHISAIQSTVDDAAKLGVLSTRSVQSIRVGTPSPETDAHAAYDDFELNQLVHALEKELAFSEAVSRPPAVAVPPEANDPRTRKKSRGWGCKPEANMRWYFVHVLGCRPIVGVGQDKVEHAGFLAAARNHHGGLHNLYRCWNVAAIIDENVMMPLATWMNYVTGLNPSTVLGMDVDSYQGSHPLTGMPYLKLSKLRSGGEIELHLTLLDDGTPTLPLKGKQSVWVKRVVELALKLTAKLRATLAPDDEHARKLFIYESSGPRIWRQAALLSDKQASAWRKTISKKYGLQKEDGKPMTFNNVRFRPTLLTRMVLTGRDLLEIKAVAVQKNLTTTFKYFAVRQTTEAGRARVATALTDIRINRRELEQQEAAARRRRRVIPIRVHKGLVSDCKNIFDPPASVRARSSYVEGAGCAQFNMCLLCNNIIIFRHHLPLLATYRKQIRSSNYDDVPNASMYDATLDVLDNLFNPGFGEFSAEDIAWAEEQSKWMDVVIDPLVYKPVVQ